jgi:hypothetical protein
MNCELMLTYDTPALRQTGSRNLMGPKTLPTIWGTYMKLVTKYQISAINSCWEKCAYMFNVYKNQLSRQTGSRNLTGPKMLPTIWYTYMTLVTKYQISAINSYWEKCDEKYLGWTDRGKTVYPPPPSGSGGIIKVNIIKNKRDPSLFMSKLLLKFQNILRNTTQVIILPTSVQVKFHQIPLCIKLSSYDKF